MALEDADLETDMFYAEGRAIRRRGLVEARETDNQLTGRRAVDVEVAEVSGDQEGAAEQIARALNRLPKADALLVEIAQRLRAEPHDKDMDLASLANRIEDFVCG